MDLFCEYANWEAYMQMRVRTVAAGQRVGTHVGGIIPPDWTVLRYVRTCADVLFHGDLAPCNPRVVSSLFSSTN